MVDQARVRGIYDELYVGDLLSVLAPPAEESAQESATAAAAAGAEQPALPLPSSPPSSPPPPSPQQQPPQQQPSQQPPLPPSPTHGGREEGFDLIICCDVLVYVGNLTPIFRAVARTLRPGGCLLFSTEKLRPAAAAEDGGAESDYVLSPTKRFRHTEGYVRREAAASGLEVVLQRTEQIRRNAGKPVIGDLFVMRRG